MFQQKLIKSQKNHHIMMMAQPLLWLCQMQAVGGDMDVYVNESVTI
jgi:hypothetical protein